MRFGKRLTIALLVMAIATATAGCGINDATNSPANNISINQDINCLEPKNIDSFKLSAYKSGIMVRWECKDENASGYEVQYSTDKGFEKLQSEKIDSLDYNGIGIERLEENCDYYVRIRAYIDNNGSRRYSGFSDIKSIHTYNLIYNSKDDKKYRDEYFDGEVKEEKDVWRTDYIAIKQKTTYYFTYPFNNSKGSTKVITFFDKDKKLIKTYSINEINKLQSSRLEEMVHGTQLQYGYVTPPDNAGYMIINFSNGGAWGRANIKVFENGYADEVYSYNSKLGKDNKLNGKSVVFYGTSIGWGLYAKQESFIKWIAGANEMKLTNISHSGMAGQNYYLPRVSENKDNIGKYDYCIIEGFANDAELNIPLGEISPDGTTEFDKDTFIGMLEDAIYQFQSANYDTKLGFVLTPRIPKYILNNEKQLEYWDAATEVFEKYGVDYINLYSIEVDYASSDHPSIEGHMQMAESVELWMNTL